MEVDGELVTSGLSRRLHRVRRLCATAADSADGSPAEEDAAVHPVFRDERDVLVAAALAAPSVAVQRELLAGIARPEDRSFLLSYALGSMFCDVPVLALATDAGTEAACVVLLSLLRWQLPRSMGDAGAFEAADAERAYIRAVCRLVGSRRKAPFPLEPWVRFGALLPGEAGKGLTDFRAAVGAAKGPALPVTGPDVWSILQELCDPTATLDADQLRVAAAVMTDWRLEATFAALLCIRLLGPYEAERSFLFASLDGLRVDSAQRRLIEMVRDREGAESLPHPRRLEYCTRLLRVAVRLASALRSRRPQAVTDAIIEAFDLDAALVEFMDWVAISDVLSAENRFFGARTAFVTLLMNADAVRRRFPEVSLATGKGAFVSDLTSLIDPRRRTDALLPFLIRLRALPGSAERHLAVAILERPIVERITGALPTPTHWPRELPPIDSARPSIVRIDLARLMRERGLIDVRLQKAVTRQETEQLRLSYFKGRMQRGRVRIDWPALERVAASAAGFDLVVLRSMLADPRGRVGEPDFLRRLASLAAERLSDALLYESDRSLDQALSNNLRHGVVLPRILRAFDDAFQTAAGEPDASLPVWDEDGLQVAFAGYAADIVALREAVSSRVKAFVAYWLTVEPRGAFTDEFRGAVATRLLEDASGLPGLRPAGEVCAVLRDLVERHLAEAARRLEEEVGPGIMADVQGLRAAARAAAPMSMAAFLDCLETNLHEALAEIPRWLQIASSDGPSIPFKLAEVVKISLLSTHLSAWNRLKVSMHSETTLRGARLLDPAIDGRYLEMFEVLVHNLLSNAFRHSGLGLKTEIRLELLVGDGRMTVRCVNAVADRLIGETIARHPETLLKAKREHVARARLDTESGFHKMRNAVAVATGQDPSINLPAPSAKRRRFVVEIACPCPTDLLPT